MNDKKGFCLPSQDIRKAIKTGKIKAKLVEDNIQTNSLDLTLGDCCYWIADTLATELRANVSEPVEQAIQHIPKERRKKFDIKNGFVLRTGHNYLIPLNESLKLEKDEYAKMSPKSSIGRTFTDVRGFAEGNPCSDLIHPRFMNGEHKRLWILVRPLRFDVKIQTNLSLNQLRIFKGINSKVTRGELLKQKLVLNEDEIPHKEAFLTEDGLIAHLNLTSWDNSRKLSKLIVEPGDALILFTKEYLNFPKRMSGEMKAYSLTNVRGPLHFAGFFDNRFRGSGVMEFISEEDGTVVLSDEAPIAEFDYYWTRDVPDKLYGDESSNSNYFEQKGPKMAKYFKPVDTKGLIALRAVKTPSTLDLTQTGNQELKNFFEIL